TGVDAPLYGGTDVFLKALSTNQLEKAGHGVFYNPKYNQALAGNGVWRLEMEGDPFSNIVGTFDYVNHETVTADNGATGTLLADGFIRWISGDWSAATSITGDWSAATADISGFTSPSYALGSTIIYGGKHWTNTTGSVGSDDDDFTLNAADWTVIAFNSTDYNVVVDPIEYDYEHDLIVYRKEVEANNIVSFDLEGAKDFECNDSWVGNCDGSIIN